MASLLQAGYEPEIVLGFIYGHEDTVLREDGQVGWINGHKLEGGHRETLKRWARAELVGLKNVDQFLMKFDLMLFELEMWAEERYGHDGFHESVWGDSAADRPRVRPASAAA